MAIGFAKRLACAILILSLPLVILRLLVPDFILLLFPDDAFYYLQIARNVSRGLGATFDGINPTNGYHPLWLSVLSLMAKFFHSPSSLVFATLFLQILLAGAGIAVLTAIFSRAKKNEKFFWLSSILIFFNPLPLSMLINGLESSLYFFLLILAVLVLIRFEERQVNSMFKWFLCGLLLGLVFLARLDGAIFAFWVVVMLLLGKESPGQLVKKIFSLATGFLILALPYLLYNWYEFGHPVPISGRIKSFYLSKNYIYLLAISTFYLLSIAGVFYFHLKSRSKQKIFPKAVFPLLQFCISIIFYYLLTPTFAIALWYYAPLLLLLIPALALVLSQLWQGEKSLSKAEGAGLVLLAVIWILCGFMIYTYPRSQSVIRLQNQVVLWIKQNLPANARLAAWSSGAVAYFSERQTVNLDGLVNSPEYFFQYRRKGKAGEFIRKMNVDYVVVYYLGPRDPNRLGIKLEPVFEARDSYQGIATRFRKIPVSYYIFQTEFCKHPPQKDIH